MSMMKQAGVTLMELVVTLALLGILAAIGTPVLLNNIRAAKNADAQNTLKSIYLMEKEWFMENQSYFAPAADISAINDGLFHSINAISKSNNSGFSFSIEQSGNGYKACAQSEVISFSINELNQKMVCGQDCSSGCKDGTW